MNAILEPVVEKVHAVVQMQGSVTLSNLESALDTSYNLVFLAIDRLASEKKIKIRRGEWDYIISKS